MLILMLVLALFLLRIFECRDKSKSYNYQWFGFQIIR